MSTNIKVCVRVRPENEKERAAEQNPVVCVIDESLLMFDPVYDQRGMLHLYHAFHFIAKTRL